VDVPFWMWLGVLAVILVMLAIDLLGHRQERVVTLREAAAWSGVWVAIGLGYAFSGAINQVLGAFEALGRFRSFGDQLTDIVAILICAALGLWALRRYLRLLLHAEVTANQADCPGCKAYGRFKLESESASDESVRVCCTKCQHRWTISQ